jgi:hypothetical protein
MITMSDQAKLAGQTYEPGQWSHAPPLDAIPPEPSYLERLRDELAMRAMAAWIGRNDEGLVLGTPLTIARWAYEVADAMLAERGKR